MLARGRFERVERNRNVLVRELETLGPLTRQVAEVPELGSALPTCPPVRPPMTIRRVVPNFRSDEPAADSSFYEILGFQLGMDMDWIATFVSPSNPNAQVTLIRADRSGMHPDASVEVGHCQRDAARLTNSGTGK